MRSSNCWSHGHRCILWIARKDYVQLQKLQNHEHFPQITDISLKSNGQEQSGEPIKLDFAAGTKMEGYWCLLQTAGKVLKDDDMNISREDYVNGYMLVG